MDNDKIRIETQSGGMERMAEMLAPGTQVFRNVVQELEEKKMQLALKDNELKKCQQDRDYWKQQAEYFRDLYNQMIGTINMLSHIVLSLPKVKAFVMKLPCQAIALVRSMLLDTLFNPAPETMKAICEATQLPDKEPQELRFESGSQNTIYTNK